MGRAGGRTWQDLLLQPPAWRHTLVRTWLLIFYLYAKEEEEKEEEEAEAEEEDCEDEVTFSPFCVPAMFVATLAVLSRCYGTYDGHHGLLGRRFLLFDAFCTHRSTNRCPTIGSVALYLSVVHFSGEDLLAFARCTSPRLLMDDYEELIPKRFFYGWRRASEDLPLIISRETPLQNLILRILGRSASRCLQNSEKIDDYRSSTKSSASALLAELLQVNASKSRNVQSSARRSMSTA